LMMTCADCTMNSNICTDHQPISLKEYGHSLLYECGNISADDFTIRIVFVEALPRLLSEPPGVDHALEQNRRAILRIACALVERALDGEESVQADAEMDK
jgi:hypothetical protein